MDYVALRFLYPSRKTFTTQASTPRAIHAGQNWPRQPSMLGEGTSSYLRKPPLFLGGSDDFSFCWKRPEEEDNAGERCDVDRGDELWRPLGVNELNCRLWFEPDDVEGRDWAPLDKKDSLLFAVTKAVVDANAAATFSAPLEKDRWNWSSKGSSMGQPPESPMRRKRAVTVHNWKLYDSIMPRKVVSKVAASLTHNGTDLDSAGLEDIRSKTWDLTLTALPWQGESDTLSVLETDVNIEDSDLPLDTFDSNFLCAESPALLICPNQARLEDCWDDSSTRPALFMIWNWLEEGWTKGWEAAGNFLVI